MRPLTLLILLLLFAQTIQSQENPRMELRHIRLEDEMSQHDFAMTYNICWEQVHQHLYHREVPTIPADIDLYFPPDLLPCYNEAGQRLIFYEIGESLAEPYYSDMRVYVTVEGETLESLTRAVNVCIEEILPQNEHFYDYYSGRTAMTPLALNYRPFMTGQELFIPARMPCYDDEGRKLLYTSTGIEALEGQLYFLRYGEIDTLHFKLNICPEALLAANRLDTWPTFSPAIREIVIPSNAPDCYRLYREEEYSPEALALMLNVCLDALQVYTNYNGYGYASRYYYVRYDAPACQHVQEITSDNAYYHLPSSGDNLESISRQYNVCASDLLEANGQTRPQYGSQYRIPQTRPCYNEHGYKLLYQEDGSAPVASPLPLHIFSHYNLQEFAWEHNLCPGIILELNPQLNPQYSQYRIEAHYFRTGEFLGHGLERNFISLPYGTEVFFPQNPEPCYEFYPASTREEVLHLASSMNICIEKLLSWAKWQNEQRGYMIPDDYEREACYDENGHRLSYFDEYGRARPEPVRLSNAIYLLPHRMSAYELSRRLNICVNELLALNYILTQSFAYENLEIFIPETAPCYDEATGKQLIYTDENGMPLDEPQLSEYLIHEVKPNTYWSTVTILYNVCYNRLLDFNEGFLPNVWTISPFDAQEYVADNDGFFEVGVYLRIPTDRPPCYDLSESGRSVNRYVCYDEAIDMSQENPDAVINPDGRHCYDIQDPGTVIWHNGDHYLYQVREGYLYTNEFMAWCFGVSEDDIIAEAENEIAYIWPYAELLVRNPARLCYAREYDGQENVHWVTAGESLRSIAWQYGKLPQWIAEANGLTNPDIIWEYQRLVIPEGINLWHLYYVLSAFVCLLCLGIITRFVLKRRALGGVKKKR